MDDFWWLPAGVPLAALRVGVAHACPVRDDDEVGPLDREEKPLALSEIPMWRRRWKDENVFRTLALLDSTEGKAVLFGPFCIDIDSGSWSHGRLAVDLQHLQEAHAVASAVTEILLERGVAKHDLRVNFSGHKGFNAEVRPEALNLSCAGQDVNGGEWSDALSEIIDRTRNRMGYRGGTGNQVGPLGTTIDRVFDRCPPCKLKGHKSHLRLLNSRNVWLDDQGVIHARMKMPVSLDELASVTTADLVDESERRAAAL